jgi:hypothetical protein
MQKKYYIITAFLISLLSCKQLPPHEILNDGLEELIAGKLYVMHSMIYKSDEPWTTSNIFIIKGTGDTVWIFGTGYGDFNEPCEEACNDNNYYLGKTFHGTGPAIADAMPVDSIITNVFEIDRSNVTLQFIVPHYHNDHINSEFIDAFYNTMHYPIQAGEHIWIHINDSIGALCNEPCCGTQPCPDKSNKYYGVPYMPSWKEEYKAMFKTMGLHTDACNTVIKTFTSASGIWEITKSVAVKANGHTDGTINLHNKDLKLRIAGTKSKVQCPLPEGWQAVTVHGNTEFKP